MPLSAQRSVASAAESVADTRASEALLDRTVTLTLRESSLRLAIDATAALAGVHVNYRPDLLDTASHVVTAQFHSITLRAAFAKILAGTRLQIVPLEQGKLGLVIATGAGQSVRADGVITGYVVDAKTKKPIRGVLVLLDDAKTGITTNDDGTFRMTGIASGAHVVHVRKLSYAKRSQTVNVVDGEPASMTLGLEPSVNALDQVVVTGTVVPTELRAVPNAITVITGKELEQRGITHIDQLFHGDVPGVFAQENGDGPGSGIRNPGFVLYTARGSSTLPDNAGSLGPDAGSSFRQGMKTYVDGILVNGSYVGLIDPKSIERIEILTGPQASTIYGSGAISGVIQVFTKRGSSARPEVTVAILGGFAQNQFSSSLAPQLDNSIQMNGVDSHLSYRADASLVTPGSWSPGTHFLTLSGSVAGRYQQGPITIDMSLRRAQARNWSDGTGVVGNNSSQYYVSSNPPAKITDSNNDESSGLTLTWAPFQNWSATGTFGSDRLTREEFGSRPRYSYIADSAMPRSFADDQRLTTAFSTTLRIPLLNAVNANVTIGGDGRTQRTLSLSGRYTSTGSYYSYTPDPIYPVTDKSHGSGAFLQSQLGFWDMVFLTYGLRADWDPNYGADANPNYVPRYGMAITHEIGAVTAKLRADYGHSTRAPQVGARDGRRYSGNGLIFPANAWYVFPNADLLPEQKGGVEGGLDLYLGSILSLNITRYNNTSDNLVYQVNVDSIPRLDGNPDPYGYCQTQPAYCGYGSHLVQSKFLNLGSVRDQGWEVQGATNVGRLSMRGTYSFTKSRIIGITPLFRTQFPGIVVGQAFNNLAEHTWSYEVAYATGGNRLAYHWQGQGKQLTPFAFSMLGVEVYSTRLQSPRVTGVCPPPTYGFCSVSMKGYGTGSIDGSHRFTQRFDGELHIVNVWNNYQTDAFPGYRSGGRQERIGVRVRF